MNIVTITKPGAMKLEIKADELISDVQGRFNHCFPYLKLEFFKGHTNLRLPARTLTADSRIGDITDGLADGDIQLTDTITVAELEDIFNERFGLHVHVLRKSGNIWLETTMTNTWTLQLQNDHGREISMWFDELPGY